MKMYFFYIIVYLLGSFVLYQAIPLPTGHYDVDSYGYDSIAAYFASTGVLTDPHQPGSAPIQPVGYSFIVGLFYKLFGDDVRPVLIAQIFLMCAALALLMLIAQRVAIGCVAGAKVTNLAGFFFLLTPGFYIYPQLLLAETILLVLVLLMFERYIFFLQTGQMSALIMAGLCAGISMLIKPVVMLFMITLVILTWFSMRSHKKTRRETLLCVLLLGSSFAIPVALYIVRNYIRYGHASFAPMMSLNIYQIFLSKVMGNLTNKDPQEIIETTLRFKGVHSFDASGWDHARILFVQHVKNHPLLCAKIWSVNVCKTWCGLYVTQLKKMIEPDGNLVGHSFFMQQGTLLKKICSYIAGETSYNWVVALGWYECIWSMLRMLFALLGLYVLFGKDALLGWLFFCACISLSVPTGIDGCCRYRIIFEAIFILLSALGFLRIYVYCFYTKEGARVWFFPIKKYLPVSWR